MRFYFFLSTLRTYFSGYARERLYLGSIGTNPVEIYQSNFLLKPLLTGERDLCAFSLNRANGFPATEYPGSFPLPNIGVAARSLLSSVLVLGNPVPSFLISLREEKIPRIDARLDS